MQLNYLLHKGMFENTIHRGGLSFRSSRLDAVVAAIDAYIAGPSETRLDAVEKTLQTWEKSDPREFQDRGLPLKTEMTGEIQLARVQLKSGAKKVTIPVLDPGNHPKYEPNLWNSQPYLTSTNCYAYACNSRTGHFTSEKPQPGSYAKTGMSQHGAFKHHVTRLQPDPLSFSSANPSRTAAALRLAIMRDGQSQGIDKRLIPAIREVGEPVENIPGHYLIALVIAPGDQIPKASNEKYTRDYHWYRQDKDGTWSHKPGHDPATNVDGSNQVIYDPRVCDMHAKFWWYGALVHVAYEFVMFYYCPRGGVRVGRQR